jgi:16S rRNA processing protein RimM
MLKIGEIVAPHGIQGEVRVIPTTDFPKRFSQLDKVTIRKGQKTRELQLVKAREHKNFILMVFKEIADRNQAEELRKWEVVIPVENAVPLPPGHFYDHQLEGLEVVDIQGKVSLGTLVEVLHLPGNAVYRIENSAGVSILIPALKSVVKTVDLINGQMHVQPLEGMLE